MFEAFVAQEREALREFERVTLRPGAPEELVALMERTAAKQRERLAELERVIEKEKA
jgi:hypothetical protein